MRVQEATVKPYSDIAIQSSPRGTGLCGNHAPCLPEGTSMQECVILDMENLKKKKGTLPAKQLRDGSGVSTEVLLFSCPLSQTSITVSGSL